MRDYCISASHDCYWYIQNRFQESRHRALDELARRVEERYREQQARNNERKTKAQVEKEHAQYLTSTYGGGTSGTARPAQHSM